MALAVTQGRASSPQIPAWQEGVFFYPNQVRRASTGDLVKVKAGMDHLSAADNQPFVGENWATYWEVWVDALTPDQADSFPSDASAENPLVPRSEAFHSTYYAASASFGAPTIVVPADRRSLLVPTDGGIKIGDGFFQWSGIPNIDMDVAANWDDSQYATAATRAGLNVCLFECQHSGQLAPDFVLSPNASYPTGHNATNSRKVGWLSFLPVAIGTFAGHPLSGYLEGDVVPASIADLLNRPACPNPAGMFWLGHPSLTLRDESLWADLWLLSGTGANAASVQNATISDTRSWDNMHEDLRAVGKNFLSIDEFAMAAAGGPEQVNIYGSQDPVKTSHIATKAFTGAGLNDLTVAYASFVHSNFRREYEIEVDATGTPDTYKIRERDFGGSWGSYTTGVAMVSGAVSLPSGGTFTFAATTGHTLGNKWNLYFMRVPYGTAGYPMICAAGGWAFTGNLWQWTRTSSMRVDSVAAHTHTVTGDPGNTGNASVDVVPAWQWVNDSGGKGQSYQQGPYAQSIMLLAGGVWDAGSVCGSRSRIAAYYRWLAYSIIGARGCARSRKL